MKKKEVKKLIAFLIRGTDVCSRCKSLGEDIPKCLCGSDFECAKNILKLWKNKEKIGE